MDTNLTSSTSSEGAIESGLKKVENQEKSDKAKSTPTAVTLPSEPKVQEIVREAFTAQASGGTSSSAGDSLRRKSASELSRSQQTSSSSPVQEHQGAGISEILSIGLDHLQKEVNSINEIMHDMYGIPAAIEFIETHITKMKQLSTKLLLDIGNLNTEQYNKTHIDQINNNINDLKKRCEHILELDAPSIAIGYTKDMLRIPFAQLKKLYAELPASQSSPPQAASPAPLAISPIPAVPAPDPTTQTQALFDSLPKADPKGGTVGEWVQMERGDLTSPFAQANSILDANPSIQYVVWPRKDKPGEYAIKERDNSTIYTKKGEKFIDFLRERNYPLAAPQSRPLEVSPQPALPKASAPAASPTPAVSKQEPAAPAAVSPQPASKASLPSQRALQLQLNLKTHLDNIERLYVDLGTVTGTAEKIHKEIKAIYELRNLLPLYLNSKIEELFEFSKENEHFNYTVTGNSSYFKIYNLYKKYHELNELNKKELQQMQSSQPALQAAPSAGKPAPQTSEAPSASLTPSGPAQTPAAQTVQTQAAPAASSTPAVPAPDPITQAQALFDSLQKADPKGGTVGEWVQMERSDLTSPFAQANSILDANPSIKYVVWPRKDKPGEYAIKERNNSTIHTKNGEKFIDFLRERNYPLAGPQSRPLEV